MPSLGEVDMQNIAVAALNTSVSPRLRGAATDEALMAAVAAGEQGAMQILYNRHRVRVFRFITRILGDANTAEDVLSETFIEVWRNAARFEGRSTVSTWIMSIARLKALSVRRRRRDDELDEETAETIADEAFTPEEAILDADRSVHLRECLEQLSPEHREIIDLVYYHDQSIDEVAQIIQVPRNTLKTRMFYARKRLATMLTEYGSRFHATKAA
jgi:RNA polymerase sigma-70 factor, ECF subfamily